MIKTEISQFGSIQGELVSNGLTLSFNELCNRSIYFYGRYFPEKEVVQIVEGGDTWKLCSIEDKLVEDPVHQLDQGKKVSVMLGKGNNLKEEGKQFQQLGAVGSNTSRMVSSPNPNSNGQKKEMVVEQNMSKEADNLVVSLVKEVATGAAMIALKESGKVELMVDADQPPTVRIDVNKSEESDHAVEPIHVKRNPETEKATTEKAETKETAPIQGSKFQSMVSTPTNISATSVQATKVIESKVTSESLLNSDESITYNEISTILQKKGTTTQYPVFSDPATEPNELRRRLTAKDSIANSNGILSSNQIVTESYPTEASMGSTEKGDTLSTEDTTVRSSNVLQTTTTSNGLLLTPATNLDPVERVSAQSANSSQTTSHTPDSRLKSNVESTTSSYSITPSSPLPLRPGSHYEEKQLYPVVSGKSTQSSVSTDLEKLASAADQKEGIASKDNIAGSDHQEKGKGGLESFNNTRTTGQANVESRTSSKKDSATPRLNFTKRPVLDQLVEKGDNGSNGIEMTDEVLLEEPLDSIELKQVMKAVLQEAKEAERVSLRQKRGAAPARRFGRARRGRKARRKGAATAARHYVGGRSGRQELEYCACGLLP